MYRFTQTPHRFSVPEHQQCSGSCSGRSRNHKFEELNYCRCHHLLLVATSSSSSSTEYHLLLFATSSSSTEYHLLLVATWRVGRWRTTCHGGCWQLNVCTCSKGRKYKNTNNNHKYKHLHRRKVWLTWWVHISPFSCLSCLFLPISSALFGLSAFPSSHL